MRLPVRRADQLEPRADGHRWLVEQLWADQGVGIVGGAPKCGKSLCALDLAVSVATGAPCLGRFRPAQTGRVLLFAAEDPPELVRERLAGIARAAARDLAELDVFVITAPRLHLDLQSDREGLTETVKAIRPKLLLLDPFVRLHSGDENVVTEVAPLLDYLRGLQRAFRCSVLLVHHARKNVGALRGGQALRGSSEFFAWTDSSLYLRRKGEQLLLSAEHRCAPGLDEVPVELCADGEILALRVADPPGSALSSAPGPAESEPPLRDRLLDVLRDSSEPMTPRSLRQASHVRMARVYDALAALLAAGQVTRDGAGYRLSSAPAPAATATRPL
jgi:hypothetical protein